MNSMEKESSELVQEVMLPTGIQVPGSKPGMDSDYHG
jgi:hypothetical protein